MPGIPYNYCFNQPAMLKKTDSQPTPKKVVSIRLDLLPRLVAKAEELQQNANQLTNLCLEGILDAMDAEGAYEIPILNLYRTLKGKTALTSKAVMTICSLIVPEVYEIDQQEKKFLIELINKHDGPLTPNILKGYRQLAVQMNKQRIERENQVAKLQREQKSR